MSHKGLLKLSPNQQLSRGFFLNTQANSSGASKLEKISKVVDQSLTRRHTTATYLNPSIPPTQGNLEVVSLEIGCLDASASKASFSQSYCQGTFNIANRTLTHTSNSRLVWTQRKH